MYTLDALRDLDVPTVTTLVVLIAIVALISLDPILGRRQYAGLVADLGAASDDRAREGLRRRFYWAWTWQGWLIGAVVVAGVALLPGIGLADIGLRLPDLSLLQPDADGDDATGMAVGAVVGFALAAGVFVRRRWPALPQPRSPAADVLWPTSPATRRGWAGLALSAGVTEEITYRGLLVLAVTLAAPGLPLDAVVAVAAVLFGLAHWYQGPLGMLAIGALGAIFTQLYLSTGSLLLPMVLHVLIDLGPLLGRPAPAETSTLVGAR